MKYMKNYYINNIEFFRIFNNQRNFIIVILYLKKYKFLIIR